ncbi:dihydrodipicolinate synthase family protein [Paenibacillus lautus]|uniref:dihydrodipicolinate synthase family protein n=1 Tax=Paenibacillus lautus TaxID=1401 RepID=UPI002DBCC713|nr:dihydrodipicolinate synthase family protein [Paenibacillus lautus]MEC0202296.1 dihydrodipicolinate synthase family protein [Paenibacillus lautus]
MGKHDLNKFKGVIVAFYGCYDGNGDIDPQTVRDLARYYKEAGVKGLYVGGSSGEGMLQSTAERKLVLEAVMEEVGSEMTIIAHVGAPSTRESVELAKHAESVKADAVSAVPSIYYRLSPDSVERHWRAMIDSTALPFIIYHIPQLTGFHLSTGLLKKLSALDNVIGVKISSESTYELQQFKAAGGPDFLVLNGPDEQYLAGRSMGADGGIGGTYGVMPELFLKLEQCIQEGDLESAREWQGKINEVISELLRFPSLYGGCKALLKLRGLDIGEPRLPLLPVTDGDQEAVARLHDKLTEYIAQAKA